MPRSLFAVVLTEGKEDGVQRLRDFYGDAADTRIYTELGSNVVLVADDSLTSRIAERAGVTKKQADLGIRGVVLKLNGSFAGYTLRTFWDWIEHFESHV